MTPVRDEEIVEAIVVVIADAARLSPPGSGQAGLGRPVAERAVAVVVEQIAGRPARACLLVEAASVHQEDVQPAIVVVIEQRHAAAHLLEQELLVVGTARDVQRMRKAGGRRDVREHHAACFSSSDAPVPGRRADDSKRWQGCRRRAASQHLQEPTAGCAVADATTHAGDPPVGQKPRQQRAASCRARCSRDRVA